MEESQCTQCVELLKEIAIRLEKAYETILVYEKGAGTAPVPFADSQANAIADLIRRIDQHLVKAHNEGAAAGA